MSEAELHTQLGGDDHLGVPGQSRTDTFRCRKTALIQLSFGNIGGPYPSQTDLHWVAISVLLGRNERAEDHWHLPAGLPVHTGRVPRTHTSVYQRSEQVERIELSRTGWKPIMLPKHLTCETGPRGPILLLCGTGGSRTHVESHPCRNPLTPFTFTLNLPCGLSVVK